MGLTYRTRQQCFRSSGQIPYFRDFGYELEFREEFIKIVHRSSFNNNNSLFLYSALHIQDISTRFTMYAVCENTKSEKVMEKT